jgi:hypothetical protein
MPEAGFAKSGICWQVSGLDLVFADLFSSPNKFETANFAPYYKEKFQKSAKWKICCSNYNLFTQSESQEHCE